MRRAAAENRNRKNDIQTDAKKFHPGKDPLEIEESINDIQPVGAHEHKQLMNMLKKLLKNTTDANQKSALQFQLVSAETGELKGVIHKEFLRDFWAWLLGRGKESDHKKSPWYRQSLANDPEISAYIDTFVTKMHEYRVKLALLKMRYPKGIKQTYLFFKYIVRGEELNQVNYLDDWQVFLQEFGEARTAGNRERNFDPYPKDKLEFEGQQNAHEMAPYGGKRKEYGNKREEDEARRQGQLLGQYDEESRDFVAATDKDAKDRGLQEEEEDDSLQEMEEDDANMEEMQNRIAALEAQLAISPERKAETASNVAAEAQQQLAFLEEKIGAQNAEIAALKTAKQPVDQQLALVGEMQANRALMDQISKDSLLMQKQFLDEITANKAARAQETADLRKFLEGFKTPSPIEALPAAPPSKPLIEDVTGIGQKLDRIAGLLEAPKAAPPGDIVVAPATNQQFAEFLNRFAQHATQSDLRLKQIEDNMIAKAGDKGPMIEELDEMTGQFKDIAASLKEIPQRILALEAANNAEREAAKSQALALVADGSKSASEIVKAIEGRTTMDKEFLEKLLKGFDGGFANMMASIKANDISGAMQQQTKVIGEIIEKAPAANKELLLEWSKQMQAVTESRIVLHEQTSNIPSTQMSNALRAMETVANQQAQMIVQNQALAQKQALLDNQLKEADLAFRKLRGEKDQQISILAARSQAAAQQAQFLENVARQGMQRSADLERQVQYLGTLNQAQYQAYQQQMTRTREEFQYWQKNAQDYIGNLMKTFPALTQGEEEAGDMDLSDEEDGPAAPKYNEGEKWLLGIGGSAPPLLLQGPKGETKEQPKGAEKPKGLRQVLPIYTSSEIDNLPPASRKVFEGVAKLEQIILDASEKFGKELGPETAHVFSVKSLKPKVLSTKITRYETLLKEWGINFQKFEQS